MNLGVTVRTAPVEIPNRIQQGRSGRMTARHVTRITDARHTYLEQLRIVRPMWFVAVRAILHDRRMFPEERPATLDVTRQTVLRCRCLDELLRIGTAVRIVTARTGDLTLAIRHVR